VNAEKSNLTQRNNRNISAVILDYGEVLCHLPTAENIEFLSSTFRADSKTFLPMYLKTRAPYDRGDLPPEEYWRQFATQAGVTVNDDTIQKLRDIDNQMWSRPNEPMIHWLRQIHAAGFKTAILSNMPTDMATHVRKTFDWIEEFDHHIFSAEIRTIKPDRAIYEHTMNVLGVDPQETIFIDDREENLAEARAIGIRAIRYQGVERLRQDLQALNFPILPKT
jgi:putative hydrolase of the HAD superfamily